MARKTYTGQIAAGHRRPLQTVLGGITLNFGHIVQPLPEAKMVVSKIGQAAQ